MSQPTDSKEEEVVTTIFISNLPRDTRYREIFNLFRFENGFHHCSFNGILGRSPTAWVKFDTVENAKKAMEKHAGFQIDPDEEVVHQMKIAFANKNSLRKQVRSPFDDAMDQFFQNLNSGKRRSNSDSRRRRSLSATGKVLGKIHLKRDLNSDPTYNVLYLGNLGANFVDEEVTLLVSKLPGFSRLRFARTLQSSTPYAYVEFTNSRTASDAMSKLSGAITSTSGNTGLKAEIAKHGKFRRAVRKTLKKPNEEEEYLTDDSDGEKEVYCSFNQ